LHQFYFITLILGKAGNEVAFNKIACSNKNKGIFAFIFKNLHSDVNLDLFRTRPSVSFEKIPSSRPRADF